MFALVHKNKVLSGPRSWSREFFVDLLKRKNIGVKYFPKKPTEELPFIIDADTKVVKVEEVREDINSMIEYHRGPIWDLSGDIAVATYEAVEQPLDFAKGNYKNLAASKRYEKEVAGTRVTVQDHEVTIDTTRDGRNVFVQQFTLMGENDIVNWKFPEVWLTLNKIEFGSIVAAGATHIRECFDWEKNLVEQIEAETTIADLVKYEDIIDPPPEERQQRLEENA